MSRKMEADVDLVLRLEQLEVGALDVAEARELLRALLRNPPSAGLAGDVYAALRSWTGRLLRSSAGGDDLRAWYNLAKATAAQFRGPLAEWSIRVGVLGEMIYERAGMAETRQAADVLCRRHVPALLGELAAAPGGRLGRADLRTRLGLEQANLTRVCTLLLDAGLIGRHEEGRTVSFELTASGSAHARASDAPSATSGSRPAKGAETEWHVADELAIGNVSPSNSSMDEWAKHDAPIPELPLAA